MKRGYSFLIVLIFFSLLFASELSTSAVSPSDEFEKMVMITCGIIITTVTCLGMCFEQWKKKMNEEEPSKTNNINQYVFRKYDSIVKERF